MADVAKPAAPADSDNSKDDAAKAETSPPKSGQQWAIYDVASRGSAKTLHEAAERGKWKVIVDFLKKIKKAGEIDSRDKVGRTPLMWAVESGSVESVERLLAAGSNVTIREAHCGRTAVHLAARSGTLAVLKTLLDSIKDKEDKIELVNQPDFNGATPVFLAKQRHSEDAQQIFEYLLSQGSKY